MPVLALWAWVVLRVGALAGERVSFHGLGRDRGALATSAIAYGGAAILLWMVCLLAHRAIWVNGALLPAAIYALSFICYTQALAKGPVGLVSAFANATVLMLFFLSPRWDVPSIAGIIIFALGSFLVLPSKFRASSAVVWMLVSDVTLVAGRLLDAHHLPAMSLPYAASLFTAVVVWLAIPITALGAWSSAFELTRDRPGWGIAAAGFNSFSYLTVLELLRQFSPTLVEAVSASAGVAATVAGVVVFREDGAARKVTAATFMTLATLILIYSQSGKMR